MRVTQTTHGNRGQFYFPGGKVNFLNRNEACGPLNYMGLQSDPGAVFIPWAIVDTRLSIVQQTTN